MGGRRGMIGEADEEGEIGWERVRQEMEKGGGMGRVQRGKRGMGKSVEMEGGMGE